MMMMSSVKKEQLITFMSPTHHSWVRLSWGTTNNFKVKQLTSWFPRQPCALCLEGPEMPVQSEASILLQPNCSQWNEVVECGRICSTSTFPKIFWCFSDVNVNTQRKMSWGKDVSALGADTGGGDCWGLGASATCCSKIVLGGKH